MFYCLQIEINMVNMKFKYFFVLVSLAILTFGFSNSMMAQIPSDVAILPYQVEEITNIIKERFEAPAETNEYIQFLVNEDDFPGIAPNQTMSSALTEDLEEWVSTHPAAIEELLIRGKKNYDKYFNPALIKQNPDQEK